MINPLLVTPDDIAMLLYAGERAFDILISGLLIALVYYVRKAVRLLKNVRR